MNNFKLNESGKRDFFKVPDSYFLDFEGQLNKAIDNYEIEKNIEKRKKGRMLSMEGFRPLLYMASMFVLILFSVGLIMNKSTNKTSSLRAQESTKEQLIPTAEDYLISNLGTYGISQYYIESEMAD